MYIWLILAEFATYLNFCRSLRFDDKPDYSYLRQLFRNLFHRHGYTYDYIFDWNLLKFVRTSSFTAAVWWHLILLLIAVFGMQGTAQAISGSVNPAVAGESRQHLGSSTRPVHGTASGGRLSSSHPSTNIPMPNHMPPAATAATATNFKLPHPSFDSNELMREQTRLSMNPAPGAMMMPSLRPVTGKADGVVTRSRSRLTKK